MIKKLVRKIFPQKIIEIGIKMVAKLMLPYYKKKFGIVIREGTSDFEVYTSIFILKHYDLPYKDTPKLIVDCGAYVGYSAIYFATKFPNAKIMAFEPATSNYKYLKKNTHKYSNISIFQKGVWYKKTGLKIIDNNASYAFNVEETESTDFDSSSETVDGILKLSGFDKIDILKIDIEGAEFEIFSQPEINWLEKVDVYVFEFHDRLKPGCSTAVFDKLKPTHYNIFTQGEYTVFQRK